MKLFCVLPLFLVQRISYNSSDLSPILVFPFLNRFQYNIVRYMAIISHDNKVQNDYYVSRFQDTHSRTLVYAAHFCVSLSITFAPLSTVGYKNLYTRGRFILLLMIFVFSLVNALDTKTSSNQRQLLAPTGPISMQYATFQILLISYFHREYIGGWNSLYDQ